MADRRGLWLLCNPQDLLLVQLLSASLEIGVCVVEEHTLVSYLSLWAPLKSDSVPGEGVWGEGDVFGVLGCRGMCRGSHGLELHRDCHPCS